MSVRSEQVEGYLLLYSGSLCRTKVEILELLCYGRQWGVPPLCKHYISSAVPNHHLLNLSRPSIVEKYITVFLSRRASEKKTISSIEFLDATITWSVDGNGGCDLKKEGTSTNPKATLCVIRSSPIPSGWISKVEIIRWKSRVQKLLILRVQNFPKLYSPVALLVPGIQVYFCKDIAF